MKRFFIFLLFAAFSIYAKQIETIAEANVRTIPAVKGSVIVNVVKAGERFETKGEFIDWMKIKSEKNIVGYVYGMLVDSTKNIALGTGCAIQSEPSTASSRIGVLKGGESFIFIGGKITWYAIGSNLWISAGYVKEVTNK